MSRRRYSRRIPTLSDDIIINILLKLPVISLLRFKTVYKSWCFFINESKFIKLHIDESSVDINRQNILLISSKLTLSSCSQYNTLEFTLYSTGASLNVNSKVMCLDPPLCHDVSNPVVSSCNGILCMVYSHTILLWNPAIRKYKFISKSDHELVVQGKDYESALYGFACDFARDDYKVVATFVINAKRSDYIVLMYSVNNQSWREIDNIPVGYRLFDKNPVSLDGTINMMATASVDENGGAFGKFAIISIFVAAEKCIATPLPWENGRYMNLSNFSNRLCLSMSVESYFLVCSLEKIGETSWNWTNVMKVTTLSSLIRNHMYLDDVICLKENGNIIWRNSGGNFLEYNVRKEETTIFALREIPRTADLSILYVESLASLKIPWD